MKRLNEVSIFIIIDELVCATYFNKVTDPMRFIQGSWHDAPEVTNSKEACESWVNENLMLKYFCAQPRGLSLKAVLIPNSRHMFDLSQIGFTDDDLVTEGNCKQPGPGDADYDGDFDQDDLDEVKRSSRYMTGRLASFREGDWSHDDVFNQFDIIKALQTGEFISE